MISFAIYIPCNDISSVNNEYESECNSFSYLIKYDLFKKSMFYPLSLYVSILFIYLYLLIYLCICHPTYKGVRNRTPPTNE